MYAFHEFPEQRPGNQFGLLLREAVSVAQFSVVAVAPAVDGAVLGQGEGVAVAALRAGQSLGDGVQMDALRHRVVYGIAEPQAAVTAFAAGAQLALAAYYEGAELTRFDLEREILI